MSCGLLIAAALILSDPAVGSVGQTAPAAPPAASPAAVAADPLFARIVDRAQTLKTAVDGWIADGYDAAAFAAFRPEAEALAALDMQGHVALRESGADGDLKCILRGISEDMPGRLDAVQAATSERERAVALSELSHLLDDNAAVILAPPAPQTL